MIGVIDGKGTVHKLGSGTLTRNFFKVQTPTDNFNIERATVAKNAALRASLVCIVFACPQWQSPNLGASTFSTK
mgnify:CR=1 FL=1